MRASFVRLASFAAILVVFAGLPAMAQQPSSQSEPSLPKSPTGFPMEAFWDKASGDTDRSLAEGGPYRTSRWGNIVVRGRLEDGRVVSALSFIQCGKRENPATQVAMIGEAPDDLCDNVTALNPGRAKIVNGKSYTLYGQSTGWTVIDFAQEVGNARFNDGFPPATDKDEKRLGVSSLGAAFQIQNGKFVFFAPGETVKLTDNVNFVVKPIMEEGEISTFQTAAAFDAPLPGGKVKRPIGFYILFFGVLPLLVGGVAYRIFRRRGAKRASILARQMTGALPSNREELDGR